MKFSQIFSAIVLLSSVVLSAPSQVSAAPKPVCSSLGYVPIERITASSFPMKGETLVREAPGNPLACYSTNNVQTPGHQLKYVIPGTATKREVIIPVTANSSGVIGFCANWDGSKFNYGPFTTKTVNGKRIDCDGNPPPKFALVKCADVNHGVKCAQWFKFSPTYHKSTQGYAAAERDKYPATPTCTNRYVAPGDVASGSLVPNTNSKPSDPSYGCFRQFWVQRVKGNNYSSQLNLNTWVVPNATGSNLNIGDMIAQ